MKRQLFVFSAVAFAILFGGAARAEGVRRCADLPAVAWNAAPKTRLTIVNLDRIPSAKELYLVAMCGVRPASVWRAVEDGTGVLLEIPDGLATALDEAVPYLAKVRYMYVRGGGLDREVAVVLFSDGFRGPFFTMDEDVPWEREWVDRSASYWNDVPYEMFRRATTWLHDVAIFRDHFDVHTELFGSVEINIFEADRALANPMGTLFADTASLGSSDIGYFLHELGHYLHFSQSGAHALAYADELTGISRRNAVIPVLDIAIPFFFKERYRAAVDDAAASGGCKNMASDHMPWGYVSRYARCGEWITEDFAETVLVSLGATQKIQEAIVDGDARYGQFQDRFAPERLFARGGEDDSGVLGEKLAYIRSFLGYHLYEPQDADGDGAYWAWGLAGADCDDTNPVIGACASTTCIVASDCDDRDPCTVDRCGEAHFCLYEGVDADGDGSADTAVDSDRDGTLDLQCPGTDCKNDDPNVHLGSARSCTNVCGWQSSQVCLGPDWSECAAPSACECQPGETRTVPCSSMCEPDGRPGNGSANDVPCDRCGVKTLSCSDGSWVDPGVCDGGSVGLCAAGSSRLVEQYSVNYCGGYDDHRVTDHCRADCSGYDRKDVIVQVNTQTAPETCNGRDDDCNNVVDERCPEALTMGTPTTTGYSGGRGGRPDGRSCPVGYALVGVHTTGHSPWYIRSTVVDSLTLICQPLALEARGEPFVYDVEVAAGEWTSTRLGNLRSGRNPRTLRCDPGEVVTGMDTKIGWYVDSLRLRCGRLDVVETAGSYAVAVTEAGTTSYGYSDPPDQSTLCGGNRVVTGLSTRDGKVIDAVALQCTAATLSVRY